MYTPHTYEQLIGLEGFSEALLRDHFTLYEGYVKNTNLLLEKLATADVSMPEGAETQRRLGWEWNGMRMHELYFGNMTKEDTELGTDAPLMQKLNASFGSAEAALKQFVAIGKMRGIGWTVMAYDRAADTLLNVWVNEHDVGHLVTTTPILVMDCFEHAYIRDYGIKRADYIEAFMEAVDWKAVEERMSHEITRS